MPENGGEMAKVNINYLIGRSIKHANAAIARFRGRLYNSVILDDAVQHEKSCAEW